MTTNKSSELTWSNVSGFTWGEISNFTWEELQLSAEKLLEKARNDKRLLPVSVIDELNALCAELSEDTPKLKKGASVSELCLVLNLILNLSVKLPEIIEKYLPVGRKIVKVIVNFFSN